MLMGLLADVYRFLPPFKGKNRLGFVLFKRSIFKNSDQVISCKRGLKYSIINTHDSVGRDLFFNGMYEPQTIQTIEKNLVKGDIMIDAGANIGAICLPVAKRNDVKVYAFEPARDISKTLQNNIDKNQLLNVNMIPLALSDMAGEVDFYESGRVHGWSGIVKIDSFRHYKVESTTLDQFARKQDIEKIAVLKIDVQGWEYFVLKGGAELISEKRVDHIIFEFEWWAEKNAGLKPGAAQQFLLDRGYQLQLLDGKKITTPLTEGSHILHAFCQ